MKTYCKNKTFGFYVTLAAAVLSAVGLGFYLSGGRVQRTTVALASASLLLEVLHLVLTALRGEHAAFDLTATGSALLLAAGIMAALPTQIDNFGFLVSGLYTLDDMRGIVYFLACGVPAMLLYILASFLKQGKE